jgi:hypothetical protein
VTLYSFVSSFFGRVTINSSIIIVFDISGPAARHVAAALLTHGVTRGVD